MRQFFSKYSIAEFLEQAVQEMQRHGHLFLEQAVPDKAGEEFLSQFVREMLAPIPWGHHVELRKKIKSPMARQDSIGRI
jgi:hypothetical protein